MGIRASIGDYSPSERKLLETASHVFFPTARFARIFEAAGKTTFPSLLAYRIRKSNLFQETLFNWCGFPHPRTHFYFGSRKASIPQDFGFPFLAMGPEKYRAVETVENADQLNALADAHNPLIIQSKICFERRFHLVFVNCEFAGVIGSSSFEDSSSPDYSDFFASLFSDTGLGLFIVQVEHLLRSFQINDIAVHIGYSLHDGWQIHGMGRPPVVFHSRTGLVNRFHYIATLIQEGKL